MKYTVDIEINLPRSRVVELFDSTENRYKWQQGLQSIDAIEGETGEEGSKSKLVFKMGKRNMEMVEVITKKTPPEIYNATYEAKGVFNVVNTRFTEAGPDKTHWESENEFRFGGFMKLIGLLMKGAFPKQSLKYMKDFKAFAEKGTDVREK